MYSAIVHSIKLYNQFLFEGILRSKLALNCKKLEKVICKKLHCWIYNLYFEEISALSHPERDKNDILK